MGGEIEKLLWKDSFGRPAHCFKICFPYILPSNTGISISVTKDYFQLVLLSVEKTRERTKIDQ